MSICGARDHSTTSWPGATRRGGGRAGATRRKGAHRHTELVYFPNVCTTLTDCRHHIELETESTPSECGGQTLTTSSSLHYPSASHIPPHCYSIDNNNLEEPIHHTLECRICNYGETEAQIYVTPVS